MTTSPARGGFRKAERVSVALDCGDTVVFGQPAPQLGDYVTCSTCRKAATVVAVEPVVAPS